MICCECKTDKERVYHRRTSKHGTADTYVCYDCSYERQARYSKTPEGKAVLSEASKKSYRKNKHKWAARAKARYAVKTGKLIKPTTCKDCKETKPLQGHHEDYSKPLDVKWLCVGCHAKADRILEGLDLKPHPYKPPAKRVAYFSERFKEIKADPQRYAVYKQRVAQSKAKARARSLTPSTHE